MKKSKKYYKIYSIWKYWCNNCKEFVCGNYCYNNVNHNLYDCVIAQNKRQLNKYLNRMLEKPYGSLYVEYFCGDCFLHGTHYKW